MRAGADDPPLVSASARYLAVRRSVDIPVNEDGTAAPGMRPTRALHAHEYWATG